jgi:hypothetical protein
VQPRTAGDLTMKTTVHICRFLGLSGAGTARTVIRQLLDLICRDAAATIEASAPRLDGRSASGARR